jgi:predicted nucleotidyltransferase
MPSTMVGPDLKAIARAVADWVDDVPGVPVVFIFGSRVRGDHHEGSDVDIRLFKYEWADGGPLDDVTSEWWDKQNETHCAELEERLGTQVYVISDQYDSSDDAIRAAAEIPVYVDRKAVCVWTPRARDTD